MNFIFDREKTLIETYGRVNEEKVMREIKELSDLEFPCTTPANNKGAEFVYNLLKKEGFDAELLRFPADGKTDYQDKRTPLAWDVSRAFAKIECSPLKFDDPVIADYERHPFSIVKHSVLRGGVMEHVPLVTESQVWAGEDCRGALVLLGSETYPRSNVLSPLLDMGAIGYVSDMVPCAPDTPDAIHWINSSTDDTLHWHVQSEDRDFIGFAISPRIGSKLRAAVEKGTVLLHIECDGRRYEGEMDAVTAVLPGKSERELWLLAHLAEPMATDNATGVISAIESLRIIRDLINEGKIERPEYTIRVAFAMELYGFAAVAEHFGGYLGDRAIGALNLDGLEADKCAGEIKIHEPTYSSPFCGGYVLHSAISAYMRAFPNTERLVKIATDVGDDTFLGDPTTGLPTAWALHNVNSTNSYHHSSVRGMDFIVPEKLIRCISLAVLYTLAMTSKNAELLRPFTDDALEYANEKLIKIANEVNGTADAKERIKFFFEGEKRKLLDFEKLIGKELSEKLAAGLVAPEVEAVGELSLSPWQKYAKGIVAKRLTRGLPHDLARVPKNKRKPLPDHAIYGLMGLISASIDENKNLYEVITECYWQSGIVGRDKDYKTYVEAIIYLAECGYLSVEDKGALDMEDIKSCLKKLGIEKGDNIALHSSLSGAGFIKGGASTVINAFLDMIGKEGTLLAPTFNGPYFGFEGEVNKSNRMRPYSYGDVASIRTGAVPRAMVKSFGAKRGKNATHSFAGIGPMTDYCIDAHQFLDPPVCKNSPLEKLAEIGGKIVFFACGLAPSTYIHCFEDRYNCEFLDNAIIKYVDDNGRIRTAVHERHLPGCRDFYNFRGPEAKFYKRALELGLDLKCEKLGIAEVYVLDIKNAFEVADRVFSENRNITLCDSPSCVFCKKYR